MLSKTGWWRRSVATFLWLQTTERWHTGLLQLQEFIFLSVTGSVLARQRSPKSGNTPASWAVRFHPRRSHPIALCPQWAPAWFFELQDIFISVVLFQWRFTNRKNGEKHDRLPIHVIVMKYFHPKPIVHEDRLLTFVADNTLLFSQIWILCTIVGLISQQECR